MQPQMLVVAFSYFLPSRQRRIRVLRIYSPVCSHWRSYSRCLTYCVIQVRQASIFQLRSRFLAYNSCTQRRLSCDVGLFEEACTFSLSLEYNLSFSLNLLSAFLSLSIQSSFFLHFDARPRQSSSNLLILTKLDSIIEYPLQLLADTRDCFLELQKESTKMDDSEKLSKISSIDVMFCCPQISFSKTFSFFLSSLFHYILFLTPSQYTLILAYISSTFICSLSFLYAFLSFSSSSALSQLSPFWMPSLKLLLSFLILAISPFFCVISSINFLISSLKVDPHFSDCAKLSFNFQMVGINVLIIQNHVAFDIFVFLFLMMCLSSSSSSSSLQSEIMGLWVGQRLGGRGGEGEGEGRGDLERWCLDYWIFQSDWGYFMRGISRGEEDFFDGDLSC